MFKSLFKARFLIRCLNSSNEMYALDCGAFALVIMHTHHVFLLLLLTNYLLHWHWNLDVEDSMLVEHLVSKIYNMSKHIFDQQ